MSLPIRAAAFLAILLFAGCAEDDRYPISGQTCGPDDPVLDLQVPNCLP